LTKVVLRSNITGIMKRVVLVSIILVLGLAGNGFPETVTNQQILEKLNSIEVNIARLEVKVEEGQKSLQKQIDVLKEFMLWGFGITFAGMFALIGFVLWDRRTALAPAVKKIEVLEKKEDRLEEDGERVKKAFKKFALKEPRLAEALRFAGIL